MNQQTYRKITDGIRGLENGEKIVQFINSIATKIVYMAYVVGIIILFDEGLLHSRKCEEALRIFYIFLFCPYLLTVLAAGHIFSQYALTHFARYGVGQRTFGGYGSQLLFVRKRFLILQRWKDILP